MTPLEMIAEWRKGCSIAGPACGQDDSPAECRECTEALIEALENKLKEQVTSVMWPFGSGQVVVEHGFADHEGTTSAVLNVWARPDQAGDSILPTEAIELAKAFNGPRVHLVFSTPAAARGVAKLLNELADGLENGHGEEQPV